MLPLLIALSVAAQPAPELPLLRTQTSLVSATPEMHWFEATYLEREAGSTLVGVPVDEADGLEEAQRQAREEVRERFDGRVKRLELRYLHTGRRVQIEEVVPLPQSLYLVGEATYLLRQGHLDLLQADGGVGPHCGTECTERVWLREAVPPELQGTSLFWPLEHDEATEAVLAAEQDLHPLILDALASWDARAFTRPETVPADTLLPPETAFAIHMELELSGTSDQGACSDLDWSPIFEAPLSEALAGPISWEEEHEDEDLTVRAGLDLSRGRGWVELVGPYRSALRQTALEVELVQDGGQAWLVSASFADGQEEQVLSLMTRGCEVPVELRWTGVRRATTAWTR